MFCHTFLIYFENNDVRLPKNVYQLFEFSGGISSLDSKHGTKCKINENRQKIEFLNVNISKMKRFATLFSFFSTNTHARLPKNVYQLNELSEGISGLDSEHGTPVQMSEVFGLIPKYLNKVDGHLSHFSSEFHKILALTLEKSLAQSSIFNKFCLKFALFFHIAYLQTLPHPNGTWCQGFENKIFLFWSSRYYIKLPMYILLMRFFNNCPQRPSFVTSANIW